METFFQLPPRPLDPCTPRISDKGIWGEFTDLRYEFEEFNMPDFVDHVQDICPECKCEDMIDSDDLIICRNCAIKGVAYYTDTIGFGESLS